VHKFMHVRARARACPHTQTHTHTCAVQTQTQAHTLIKTDTLIYCAQGGKKVCAVKRHRAVL
jgi:hypothetical protein